MRRLLGAVGSVVVGAALLGIVPAHAEGPPPALVLISPDAWPSVLDPTALGSVSVQATNLGDQSGTLLLAGPTPRAAQTVSNDQVVALDLTTLTDGNYELSLTRCSESDGCLSVSRDLLVRRKPFAHVWGSDVLLNENGDGLWESARPRVQLDRDVDVAAQWSIKAGTQLVAGPFDMTPEQIDLARTSGNGAGVLVNAQTVGKKLAAGDYWFEVQATATEADFTKAAVVRRAIHVSSASALTALIPNASVFYPRDDYPGVVHRAVLSPRLDSRIVKYGASSFEVLDAEEQLLGSWLIDPKDPVIRWDGWYYLPTGGSPRLAPAGTYRIRLNVWDDDEQKAGLVSSPFRLSHSHRSLVQAVSTRSAAATRTATLAQVEARVRSQDGSLRYRYLPAPPYRDPLVRTAHRIRVPSDYVSSPTLRVRGLWEHNTDLNVEIVTPSGRIVDIDVYGALSRRRLDVTIPQRWIQPDGTVKFRLVWRGYGTARTDSVAISRWKYRWTT